MTDFRHALSPLELGGRTIRNRVLITGHSVLYGIDGAFSDRHVAYYVERARGGAAIVVTEQQAAHPVGRNYRAGLKAYDPELVPQWRKLTGAVQAEGALVYAQLFCGGPQGQSTQYLDDWSPLHSPSGVRSTQFGEIPAVMSQDDIRSVRDSFVRSALNMRKGGFDGIEIHAAHSQLLGSFLSPAFNLRKDGYGGSAIERCRIVVEILEAVREALGADLHIGLRLNASEHLGEAGIREPEGFEQALFLARTGLVDFVNISAGGYFAKSVSVPPMASPLPVGFLGTFTGRLKAELNGDVAVFSVGRITTLAEADQLLQAGACDMVGMTRAHMADPFLIEKARAGKSATRCIGANVCAKRLVSNLPVACVLNPRMGREAETPHEPQSGTTQRKLVVVGAGPAGLKAAATAALAGHKVTVIEASETPGGRLAVLTRLPFRSRWMHAIDDLVNEALDSGVDLVLGTVATAEVVAGYRPDLVLLATGSTWDLTGATPFRPERTTMEGLDKTALKRISLDEAVASATADRTSLGGNIVILDESFESSAAGLAILLGEAGNRVTILTPAASYADHLFLTYELPYFMGRLEDAGVAIISSVTLDKLSQDGSVTATSLFSKQQHRIEDVSTVVLAAGRDPRRDLEPSLSQAGLAVRIIGDALAPRTIESVLRDGFAAGRALWSDDGWTVAQPEELVP